MKRHSLALLVGIVASPAYGQVPVYDAATHGEEAQTSDNATNLRDTGEDIGLQHGQISCSVYRGASSSPTETANRNPKITALVRRIAREEGVDEALALAVVYQESKFDPCAGSHAGAHGLMQLMPGTAQDLGVNRYNIEDNVRGGMRYLKKQLVAHNGDVGLALAAYNAGPGNVQKYGGVPPFKETLGYVYNIEQKWMPAFGGYVPDANASGYELNGTWSSTATQQSRSVIDTAATTAAMSDNVDLVRQFYEGKAATFGQADSLLDMWDNNTDVRNANAALSNQLLLLMTQFVDAINTRNVVSTAVQSSIARQVDFDPDSGLDTDEPTPVGPCSEGQIWKAEVQGCVVSYADVPLALDPDNPSSVTPTATASTGVNATVTIPDSNQLLLIP